MYTSETPKCTWVMRGNRISGYLGVVAVEALGLADLLDELAPAALDEHDPSLGWVGRVWASNAQARPGGVGHNKTWNTNRRENSRVDSDGVPPPEEAVSFWSNLGTAASHLPCPYGNPKSPIYIAPIRQTKIAIGRTTWGQNREVSLSHAVQYPIMQDNLVSQLQQCSP
ncbi:hypothetical protein C8R44DRAFT_730710 [Mycena epipterygia]|nr:hypothetical protein C8R44DRAFT_730710 [Mycena epipterygia]